MTEIQVTIGDNTATFDSADVPYAGIGKEPGYPLVKRYDLGKPLAETMGGILLEEGAVLLVEEHDDGEASVLLERGELTRIGGHPTLDCGLRVGAEEDGTFDVGTLSDGQGLFVTNAKWSEWAFENEALPEVPPYGGTTGSPHCFPGEYPYQTWSETVSRLGLMARRPALFSENGKPYNVDDVPGVGINQFGVALQLWDRNDSRGRKGDKPAAPWSNDDCQHANGTAYEALRIYQRWPSACVKRIALAQLEMFMGWKGIGWKAEPTWLIHPRHYGRVLQLFALALDVLGSQDRLSIGIDHILDSIEAQAIFALDSEYENGLVYAPPHANHIPDGPWTSSYGTGEILKGLAMAYDFLPTDSQKRVARRLARLGVASLFEQRTEPGRFFEDWGAAGGHTYPKSNIDLWTIPGLVAVLPWLKPFWKDQVIEATKAAVPQLPNGWGPIRTFGPKALKIAESE